ncbi:MAG: hypothetical protein HZB25_00025 [Candidatus Eisenbacteria bacterium]|nr:hypothetical protein [Candidatus Eisenbacteria bacterium]
MTEDLTTLVELARQDTAWAEVRRALEEFPARLHELDRRLEELKKGAAEARAALEAGRVERRQMEGQAQDLETELRRLSSQLPQLKTNEAYAAMLKEIDGAKERRSVLETGVLELMDREERQSATLKAREAALASNTAVLDGERRKLESDRVAVRARSAETEAARGKLLARLAELNPQVRARYERLLSSKGGHAVGLVVANACGGCHAALTPQLLAEVKRRDEVRVCQGCGRLLVWGEA